MPNLANRLLQVGVLSSIASRPLSPATSALAVSMSCCAFIYDDSPFVNFCEITAISRWCLKPVAGVGRESATSSHRSSNRSAWLPASKSRRTRYASHDGHVSNKEDGDDEHCRHLDFQTGGDRALAHSFGCSLRSRLALFYEIGRASCRERV